MKIYILTLELIISLALISLSLAGCSSGVPQAQYDATAEHLAQAKEKLDSLEDENKNLAAQRGAADAALKTAQAQIAELQGQVSGLKEQYGLIGETPAETAENIVRFYHETHIYNSYDLFVCSDMASEVWNMLKAQGINAIIAVGNKDTAVTDIIQSNHSWVLAEVAPREHLALETTGGYAVSKSQNALYYRGWAFDSPADLKSYQFLVKEYNVRVGIRNQLAAEDRTVVAEHNQATNQSTADKLEAVHNKLVELVRAQETELNNIMSEINSLASLIQ